MHRFRFIPRRETPPPRGRQLAPQRHAEQVPQVFRFRFTRCTDSGSPATLRPSCRTSGSYRRKPAGLGSPVDSAQQPRQTRLFHVLNGLMLRAWFRFYGGPCGGTARCAGSESRSANPARSAAPSWQWGRQVRNLLIRSHVMADTRTAPTLGRLTLRASAARSTSRPVQPASKYARAFMLRLARRLAQRASRQRQRQQLRAPSASTAGEGQA